MYGDDANPVAMALPSGENAAETTEAGGRVAGFATLVPNPVPEYGKMAM